MTKARLLGKVVSLGQPLQDGVFSEPKTGTGVLVYSTSPTLVTPASGIYN